MYLSQGLGGLGEGLMNLDSNSSVQRLVIREIIGNPWLHHGPVQNTLQEEVGIFQAKHQQGNDLWDRHGGPVRKYRVLLKFVLSIEVTGSTGTHVKRALTL